MNQSHELLSPDGFRNDGRRPKEIRSIDIFQGSVSTGTTGSALVKMGCTTVLACIHGPTQRYGSKSPDFVKCSYSLAPFGGSAHTAQPRRNKSSIARSALIKRTFESVIYANEYKDQLIRINIFVLEDQGSSLAASINATMLALIDACIHVNGILSSCSVGLMAEQELFVDLTLTESQATSAELTLAMYAHSAKILMIDLDSTSSSADLLRAVEIGVQACKSISAHVTSVLLENATKLQPVKLNLSSPQSRSTPIARRVS